MYIVNISVNAQLSFYGIPTGCGLCEMKDLLELSTTEV